MSLPSNPIWTYSGWGGGGYFTTIYPDPTTSSKIWMMSDVTGLYSSTDRGDHWSFGGKGFGYVDGTVLIQAPSSSSTFYHAAGCDGSNAGGSLDVSTDGGATWTNKQANTNVQVTYEGHRALAVDRTDSTIVYIGNASGKIYKSTDGGATISLYASPFATQISALYITLDGAYLWAGCPTGLVRYKLSDASSQTITMTGTNASKNEDIVGFTKSGIHYIGIAAGTKIAYATETIANGVGDTGSLFIYSTATGASASQWVRRMAVKVDAGNNTRFIIGYDAGAYTHGGGIQKSTDSGVTWANALVTQNLNTADNPTGVWNLAEGEFTLSSIEYDPNSDDIAYFTTDWRMWRTDDNGVTWNEKVHQAGNQVLSDLRIAPDNSIYAASMDDGLMRSTDGGTTWAMLFPDDTSYNANKDGHVWKVVCLGTPTQWANSQGVVVATNYPWNGTNKHQIIRSTNQGGAQSNKGNWLVGTGIGIPNIDLTGNGVWGTGYARSISLDPNNTGITTGHIWVGLDSYSGNTNGGVFLSTDAGQTFTRKTANPQPGSAATSNNWKIYNGLAVNPTDSTNIVYATFGGNGIFYSTDSGATWNSPAGGNQYYMYDVKFGIDGTCYACGDSAGPAIYRSTDKGAHWSAIWHGLPTSGPADAMECDPGNKDRMTVSITAYAGKAPCHVFFSENATAGTPTWTDVTGNLPDGTGGATATFRNSEGTNGYLYIGRYAGGIFKLNLAPTSIGTLTSTSVTPASLVSSVAGNVTVAFTTVTSIPANGIIQVTFPTSLAGGFTFSSGGTTAASSLSGLDGSLAVSISSNVLTMTRSGGTTSTAGAKSFVLSHIMNPVSAGSTGTYQIQTQDGSGTPLDQDLAVAASTITQAAGTYTFNFKGVTITGIAFS